MSAARTAYLNGRVPGMHAWDMQCAERNKMPETRDAMPGMVPHLYKTQMCIHVSSGRPCPRGKACCYAHSKEELRPVPQVAKSRLCHNFFRKGYCKYGHLCMYRHTRRARPRRQLGVFRMLANSNETAP